MKILHIIQYSIKSGKKYWVITSNSSEFNKRMRTFSSITLALAHAWARKREGWIILVHDKSGAVIALIENEKHLIEFEEKLFQ